MVPLSPSLLVGSASTYANITQSPRTAPAALFRDAPLGGDEEMWGLHFLHHVGLLSHVDHRARVSSWPLPATRFVSELVALAEDRHVVLHTNPMPGDVFALWSPAKGRHVRVGILVDVDPMARPGMNGDLGYQCTAIECVVQDVDGAIVRSVVLRERRLTPAAGDCFIRWTEMRPGQVRILEAA